MFADLRAKVAAYVAANKTKLVALGGFAAGAHGGPLAAQAAEYVGPYAVDIIVKVLGG